MVVKNLFTFVIFQKTIFIKLQIYTIFSKNSKIFRFYFFIIKNNVSLQSLVITIVL